MITISIPGKRPLNLQHLVCDVNGTLAVDGNLIPSVCATLKRLQVKLEIHLITADTHGKQDIIDQSLGLRSIRIKPGREAGQKARYVRSLDPRTVVAIGQGANDVLMLKTAALGICVISDEGTCIAALSTADILVKDIHNALHLLENPTRISATLRK